MINKRDGIIIDVRTSKEFSSGHIFDATNIDYYSEQFLEKLNLVRKDLPIYLYCRSGGRSSSAAKKMNELGFQKVYNLLGGISLWEAKGYEIISSTLVSASKQPILKKEELNRILDNNNVVLVNFSTQWCVPCKKMKPIIEDIQIENPNIKVLFVDADINKELVKEYQINGVPSVLIFHNSQELFRNIGIISKEELINQIN
tara:strand:+ start:26203 stop:26805 length:603 start_codon:yes stop_codon:yes gene_type:complete